MPETVNAFRWWLSPDLKIYTVPRTHPKWAEQYFEKQGIRVLDYDLMDTMSKMGWIRLILLSKSETDNTPVLYYENDFKRPSPKAIKFIKDFAIENGASEICDDGENRKYERIYEAFITNRQLKQLIRAIITEIKG